MNIDRRYIQQRRYYQRQYSTYIINGDIVTSKIQQIYWKIY